MAEVTPSVVFLDPGATQFTAVHLLTPAEFAVLDRITEVVKAFGELGEHHPSDRDEFVATIHVLQRQVMARAARRAYPAYFRPMGPDPDGLHPHHDPAP